MTLGEIAEELVNKIDQLLMQKDYIGAEHIVNKRLREVVEDCALQVRHDCTAWEGSGHMDAKTDCEYCGRPMAAIRARS